MTTQTDNAHHDHRDQHAALDAFRTLGLAPGDFGPLVLAPLIRVAWADGRVDDTERAAILEFGDNHSWLTPRGRSVVEGWLDEQPDPRVLDYATEVLVWLAWRDDGAASDVHPTHVARAVEFSESVARSGKKWFGKGAPSASTEAVENLQAEVADLHARFGPEPGAFPRETPGDFLTPEWEEVLDELKTRQPGNTASGPHAAHFDVPDQAPLA